MKPKPMLTALLVIFLGLALAACGGEDNVTTPTAIPLLPTFAPATATPTLAPSEPTITPTEESTVAPTATLSATATVTPTETAVEETPTASPTLTPTVTLTATETLTITEAVTITATMTATAPVTATATITATETATITPEAAAPTGEITATTTITTVPDFAGVYTATLPAASSPGRAITLTLSAAGEMTMTTDYLNNEPPIVEIGTWTTNDDGTATVALTGQADRAYDEPDVIQFALEDDRLVAVEYDESLYGEEGLHLQKQTESAPLPAELVGVVWRLVKLAYSNDSEVVPDDPSKYTLEFMSDGRLAVQADCNRGRGSYTVDGSSLQFSPIGYTRMACPPESLFNEFTKNLESVSSYVLEDGTLNLALAMDGGIMQFESAE